MNNQVRQLVAGFLKNRKLRNKNISGVGSISSLSEEEMRAHVSTGTEPAIYVGTYKKYNNGSLYGAWVDVSSFDDYEDFIDFLYRLHADERDPEFMAQDYENFPEEWYSESGFLSEDWFDKIKYYSECSNKAAVDAYVELFGDWDEDDFEERYQGEYDSEEDFAYYVVDSVGIENIKNRDYYFDYDQFARDLFIDDYYFSNGYVFTQQ